ncbi:zinc finger CCCH domain-containing protein 45 isoform X2 [Eucalyptus grandis]|uniref:zinc finger CCCH domain-containing protein 45 isoform X2 n=1 Tax=Eucalyptus grandis TaxID=71139 RepID=UPI00192EB723|nr:zinc finger CCCH domain-containing protein 45 isoform X2 [Eucalyptus grandis]
MTSRSGSGGGGSGSGSRNGGGGGGGSGSGSGRGLKRVSWPSDDKLREYDTEEMKRSSRAGESKRVSRWSSDDKHRQFDAENMKRSSRAGESKRVSRWSSDDEHRQCDAEDMRRSSRAGGSKPVSRASDDKHHQISDLNGAKLDAVPQVYGDSHPAKHSREHIHIPCIRWTCPPKFTVSSNWRVAAGEESEEAGAEHGRAFKVLESFYPRPTYIPSNPFEPPNVKQEDYDDSLTPIIPIIGVEEMDIDESENKTSLDENQTTGSGAETISAGDVRISAGDVELAAAAAAIFFSVLVKSTEQGNIIDLDLLVKFLFDPQTIGKFMKSKTPSPESKQASPQNSQSSPPLSQPETQQTTLSLPMSSPELPPTESKQIVCQLPCWDRKFCCPSRNKCAHQTFHRTQRKKVLFLYQRKKVHRHLRQAPICRAPIQRKFNNRLPQQAPELCYLSHNIFIHQPLCQALRLPNLLPKIYIHRLPFQSRNSCQPNQSQKLQFLYQALSFHYLNPCKQVHQIPCQAMSCRLNQSG